MSIDNKFDTSRFGFDPQGVTVTTSRPVMLALSSFNRSDRVIETALEKASQYKKLVIVFGHYVNPGLCFIESGVGLFSGLKEQCEKMILSKYENRWKEEVEIIAGRARLHDIEVSTYVHVDHFICLCLKAIKKENPLLVVTKRSHRPVWKKFSWKSSADYLSINTGCYIIEV